MPAPTTTDEEDFKMAGRSTGPTRGDMLRAEKKIDGNRRDHVELQLDYRTFKAEQLAEDKSLLGAVSRIEASVTKAGEDAKESREHIQLSLDGINTKLDEQGREGEEHGRRLDALEAKISAPAAPAVASALPVTASPVHPLAIPSRPSIYQQMTPAQKGGGAAAVSLPALIILLWQYIAPLLGG